MTFDKLRLSIYESYQNGEISRENATTMLESVLEMEGDHIVAESEAIRSEFMSVALECANGDVEFSVFEKKAETFGDKVKAVWKKFVDWVKKIVNGIKSRIFPKKKKTIDVSEEFLKFCDKVSNFVNQIKANGDLITIAKAGIGIAIGGLSIFGGKKLVKKNAEWVHKKLSDTATGLQNVVEWLYNKLPKGIQESGIMKPLREYLNKINTADNQVVAVIVKYADVEEVPATATAQLGGPKPQLGAPKAQLKAPANTGSATDGVDSTGASDEDDDEDDDPFSPSSYSPNDASGTADAKKKRRLKMAKGASGTYRGSRTISTKNDRGGDSSDGLDDDEIAAQITDPEYWNSLPVAKKKKILKIGKAPASITRTLNKRLRKKGLTIDMGKSNNFDGFGAGDFDVPTDDEGNLMVASASSDMDYSADAMLESLISDLDFDL